MQTPTNHLDLAWWRQLARHETLTLLLDYDGTLAPFAPTPEQATLPPETADTLRRLVAAGVRIAIVSGRTRDTILPLIDQLPAAWWFAEHGAWQRIDGAWHGPGETTPELDEVEAVFRALRDGPGGRGTRIERKSLSVCLHWRLVEPAARAALIAAAELATDEWLESHDAYERLPGVEMIEVRRRAVHKGLAVRIARDRIASPRLVAIGDDVTDEDMFAELDDGDAAVAVGTRCSHARAHAAVAGPREVRDLLAWIVDARTADVHADPPVSPVIAVRPQRDRRGLVVISNRTPVVSQDRRREVGGLVSALEPAIRDRDGIWLGWSGQVRERTSTLEIDPVGTPARASFDLSTEWREKFYAGFCNRVLWPLFHGFPGRVSYRDDEWAAYVAANDAYARHAIELAHPSAVVWVHDYHLFLVAAALRRHGYQGRVGMFLHTPFPSPDLFETIPWRDELIAGLLAFDLVGFHTPRWADNFRSAVRLLVPDAAVGAHAIRLRGRVIEVGVFPIGVDVAPFAARADEEPDVAGLRQVLGDRRLLLGVDRLDYSKGIPERLLGFERLLERNPDWQGRVTFVQISVPSRADIPEYAELRHRVETLVGRINGRFGEADWVPVRYLYRSYEPHVLAQLYRLADVALVTPLRDGMNLVAKEFIAAQDRDAPGVLVLSRFAGAAAELTDAVVTNPFHCDGLATDFDRALRMPTDERRARHARLIAAVERRTPEAWAAAFLDRLVSPAAASGLAARGT